VTTLVFFLARPNSQTQPTTHTEYPHTPTDSHALHVNVLYVNVLDLSWLNIRCRQSGPKRTIFDVCNSCTCIWWLRNAIDI